MFFVSGPDQLTGFAIISSQSGPPFELGRWMAATGPEAECPVLVLGKQKRANPTLMHTSL